MQLILDMGRVLFFEIIQIIAGCLISTTILKFCRARPNRLDKLPPRFIFDLLLIIVSSLCGILLPLGIYGIIPIIATAVILGIRYYFVLPLLLGNILFNMVVPATSVGFMWRTGSYRILLALIVGIFGGIILRQLKIDKVKIFRLKLIETLARNDNPINYIKSILNYLYTFGPCLIIGVVLNTVFHRYFFYQLINSINIGQVAATVFLHVKGYDITRPIFLLTMVIFNILLDLKVFSGLLVLFKWRGILGYFLYYSVWILALALLNMI